MSCTTELFGDVLHPRLDTGEVFIDPARFVADPEKARHFPELPYLTVRLVFLACEYFNADTGLALVRPAHQAFYRRVFLNETIAEPRLFPNALAKVGLMASDFRTVREKVLGRFPIMNSTASERRSLLRAGARLFRYRPTFCRSNALRSSRNPDRASPRSGTWKPGRRNPDGGNRLSEEHRTQARAGVPAPSAHFASKVLPIGFASALKGAVPGASSLAFTLAPHLQPINYRGCFSRFAGI